MSLTRQTQRIVNGDFLRKAVCGFVCLLLLLFLTPVVRAAVSETELKAAFLYNFAKFVEWPAEAFSSETAPIEIAVFGEDEFTVKLRSLLSDKKAHGRSFQVKRISTPQEAKNCQIVFISSSESRRVPQVLDAVRKSPVLTIGETEQFLDVGGMMNFVFEDTQLRFEVYPEAAERVNLVISSKLLRLAKRVKKGARE
jgi:hypothetical protein